MTGVAATIALNARWELLRLRRSRRAWLFLLPVVAAPVGSAVSDLYLHVPSLDTARVLGLFVTAGLSSLLAIDLTALAVGEELPLRAHLTALTLPQDRSGILAGRLLVVAVGVIATYLAGAGLVWEVAVALVSTAPGAPLPILPAGSLLVGFVGLMLFLIGVTAAAAVVTRSAAQALVAGVMAGILAAGLGSLFLLDGTLRATFPTALALVGVVALGWSLLRYPSLET